MAPSPSSPLPPHLDSATSSIHLIVSTASGALEAESYCRSTLEPLLRERGVSTFTRHGTTDAGSVARTVTEVLSEPETEKAVTFIVLSGDGGVSEVVNAFHDGLRGGRGGRKGNGEVVLVLIPMGTANALAHSARVVAKDPLKVLFEGTPRRLPVISVRFSPGSRVVTEEGRGREQLAASETLFGCVVVSWGIHASLVAESDTAEMRKHGIQRFRMVAEKLLEEGHRYQGSVEVKGHDGQWDELRYPGDKQEGEHIYVLATLVSNLEEKFCISPASAEKAIDGTLRLVAIRPIEGKEVMRLLGLAYQGGKHVEEKDKVFYEEIVGMRIAFREDDERWRMVCVDGKIIAVEKGGWVCVDVLESQGGGRLRLVC